MSDALLGGEPNKSDVAEARELAKQISFKVVFLRFTQFFQNCFSQLTAIIHVKFPLTDITF